VILKNKKYKKINLVQDINPRYIGISLFLSSLAGLPFLIFTTIGGERNKIIFAFTLLVFILASAFLFYFNILKRSRRSIFVISFSLLLSVYFFILTPESTALIIILTYPLIVFLLLPYKKALIINTIMFLLYCYFSVISFSKGSVNINFTNFKIGTVFLMLIIISYFWKRNSQRSKELIESLALYDNLTGIANRRHLNLFLENLIISSSRNNRKFSLFKIDIDNFKKDK